MGGWSTSRPGHFTPGKQTRYPLYRRLGRPQGRSGWVRKIAHPPGFDPCTVQPVGSRYTDWATRANKSHEELQNFHIKRSGLNINGDNIQGKLTQIFWVTLGTKRKAKLMNSTQSNSKNIINLYRSINKFKKGYLTRTTFAKGENGTFLSGERTTLYTR